MRSPRLLILLVPFLPLDAQPVQPPKTHADAAKNSAASTENSGASARVELNLLGREDSSRGESRRNENIQFNLVDNNALKELNVRLGSTTTTVERFEPQRSYFGAEFGNSPPGPVHQVSSQRPGWHGSLFFNHQNSAFSARSFFQAGEVQPARENRYGFSTGLAPWKSSYLFVQGNQEKLRGSVNGNVLVPAPGERTPRTTDPRKRAMIQRFLSAFPAALPNRTDINPRALNTNAPQRIDSNDALLRLEQDMGGAGRLLASHQFISQSVDAFQLVAGQNPDTDTRSHRARLTWLREWRPGVASQSSVAFDRVGSLLAPEPHAVGPMVSVAGLSTLGPLGNIPIDRAHNLYRYETLVIASLGRHNWTAGMGVLRRQFNGAETDAHRGFLSFSNDFGRTAIENLLLGTPSQYIISIGEVHRGFRQWNTHFFAGDNWQIHPHLTLNLGLRYERAGRPMEVNGFERIPFDCDCNNLAPRLGFGYRLPGRFGILRSAYGLHYGEIFPVTYSQVRFSPPRSRKLAIPAPDLLDPLSGHAAPNLYLLDPELATPYSHQYNFSWEPAVSNKWRLQAAYTGSRSHKLLIMWYLNRAHPVAGIAQTTASINERRPTPGLAEIRWVLNGSRGYYDAGRITLIAPRVRGFSLEGAYWFSKALDLGADYTNTAYDADSRLSRSQWEFETHRDRKGRSLFDQPHAFLARTAYELPGRGWLFSAVMLLKQGTPFTVTTFDGPGFGNVDGNGGDRPNVRDVSVLGRTIGHPDRSVRLLPRSAFSFMAPTDAAGNLGVNVFRRGPIRNINAAVAKTWRWRGAASMTLRVESINLLNTPQFAEPGSTLGAPEFGYITNTLNDGRTLRLSITLNGSRLAGPVFPRLWN